MLKLTDMKKVLIISPNFPPINAADMHRVRQSLPYFKEMGWYPIVIAVEPEYVEMSEDPLLLKTFPEDIEIHRVKAWNTKWTRKFGLGNLGYRAWWNTRKFCKKIFKENKIDLVYFSTTMFPIMTLGPYWKRKYKVPFIIDMQDPWRNDYYLSVPKDQRPPKFWIAYKLDKCLEAKTMKKVDGIVSVSEGYPKVLEERYPDSVKADESLVIPFAGAPIDFEILDKVDLPNTLFKKGDGNINIAYIGRGGHDMYVALKSFFLAMKEGLKENPELYKKLRIFFVGTSYAMDGKGKKTVEPVAKEAGVESQIIEYTDRLPYFEAMKVLKDSDMVFVPGSTDSQYTASKLYPYILVKKPLLAVFHESSSVCGVLRELNAGDLITFTNENPEEISKKIYSELTDLLKKLPYTPETNWDSFEVYTAKYKTQQQVDYFNKVIENFKKSNK